MASEFAVSYDEQVELVASAWYMYLIFVFVYLVVGIIMYGCRQYFLACKRRAPSVTSGKASGLWGNEPEKVSEQDLEQLGSFRNILRKRKISNTTDNSITPSLPLVKKKRAATTVDTSTLAQQFASLGIQIDYGSENSSVKNLVSRATDSRLVYAVDLLLAYDTRKQESLLDQRTVKLAAVLRYSVELPPYESDSVYATNRAIIEARKSLFAAHGDVSAATVALDMLQLVWIGNRVGDTNYNFFLHSFNELIEDLMDHGVLTRLLNATPVASLKVLMLEMVLVYCWDHWMFSNVQSLPVVRQTRVRVFLVMCSLKLHMAHIGGLNEREKTNVEVKYMVVAGEMVRVTRCYEYIELIPMVVEMFELGADRWLFLDLFEKLVEHHGDCCMGDYFAGHHDVDEIIRIGLESSERVVKKTIELHQFLQNKYFASPSRRLRDLRPVTPGGWRR